MSFLDSFDLPPNATPDELREAVRCNAAAQVVANQIEAESFTVRALAPAENDFLREELGTVVHRALTHMDESHDYEGTAPILTVSPYGYSLCSSEHSNVGAVPIPRDAVRSCHKCGQSTAQTTPFWLALGRHILQVDLCHACAVDAIDRGAKAQTLTIPDTLPDEFA